MTASGSMHVPMCQIPMEGSLRAVRHSALSSPYGAEPRKPVGRGPAPTEELPLGCSGLVRERHGCRQIYGSIRAYSSGGCIDDREHMSEGRRQKRDGDVHARTSSFHVMRHMLRTLVCGHSDKHTSDASRRARKQQENLLAWPGYNAGPSVISTVIPQQTDLQAVSSESKVHIAVRE